MHRNRTIITDPLIAPAIAAFQLNVARLYVHIYFVTIESDDLVFKNESTT
jgi:Arc/MetJ family transcription regulator